MVSYRAPSLLPASCKGREALHVVFGLLEDFPKPGKVSDCDRKWSIRYTSVHVRACANSRGVHAHMHGTKGGCYFIAIMV